MNCTVTEMIERFDVRADDGGRATLHALSGGRGVVDGHQFMAQAVVAVSRQFAPKVVRSVSMQFCRVAREDIPAELEIVNLHEGKSFATISVRILQQEKLCATGQLLLSTDCDSYIEHSHAMPAVARPEDGHEVTMPVAGRHIRTVENLDLMDAQAPVGPPQLRVWLRYEKAPQEEVRELGMEQALLAHFTGHLSIATALRAHEGLSQAQAHQDFMSGILNIQVVFHQAANSSEWMLYDHQSTYAGEGLSYTRGEVYSESGSLLASFNQQNMIRAMPEGEQHTGAAL